MNTDELLTYLQDELPKFTFKLGTDIKESGITDDNVICALRDGHYLAIDISKVETAKHRKDLVKFIKAQWKRTDV